MTFVDAYRSLDARFSDQRLVQCHRSASRQRAAEAGFAVPTRLASLNATEHRCCRSKKRPGRDVYHTGVETIKEELFFTSTERTSGYEPKHLLYGN